MKKLCLLSIFMLIILHAFAQTTKISSKEKRPLKVEIYDLAGNQRQGWLWHSDQSGIVLSNNKKMADSLQFVKPTDIYKLKLVKQKPYLTRLGNMLLLTGAGVTAWGILDMQTSSDNMLGFFPYALAWGVIGLPSSLLLAAIPDKHIAVDYVINGIPAEYEAALPILNKYQRESFSTSKLATIPVERNEVKLKNIPATSSSLHPNYLSKIHLYVGFSKTSSLHLSKIVEDLKPLNFKSLYDFPTDNSMLNYGAAYNFDRNIRGRLEYGTTGQSQISGMFENFEGFDLTYKNTYLKLNAEYVFSPLNQILPIRFEFSVGGGPSFSKLKNLFIQSVNSIYSSTEQSKFMYGINAYGAVDFYISRYISVRGSSGVYLMSPQKLDDITFSSTGTEYNVSQKFSLTNFYGNFGFGFHF